MKHTGGGELVLGDFKTKCQAVMNILLDYYPRSGGLSCSSGSEGELRKALTNFFAAYSSGGEMAQMDDLLTYAEECIRNFAGEGFNGKLDLPYGLEKLELEIDVSLFQKHLVLDVSNLKTLIINSSLDCLTLEKLLVIGLEKLEEIHLHNINVYETPGLHLERMLGVKKLVLDSVLLVDEDVGVAGSVGVEGGGVSGLPKLEVLELKYMMDEDIGFLKECWSLSPNLKKVYRDSEILVG